jgi:phenylalanyl-tRNA synthetase beta subunit
LQLGINTALKAMSIVKDAEGWQVTPPGFRFDIAIEADLIEELGRVYGYNNLPQTSRLMRSALSEAPERCPASNKRTRVCCRFVL